LKTKRAQQPTNIGFGASFRPIGKNAYAFLHGCKKNAAPIPERRSLASLPEGGPIFFVIQ